MKGSPIQYPLALTHIDNISWLWIKYCTYLNFLLPHFFVNANLLGCI